MCRLIMLSLSNNNLGQAVYSLVSVFYSCHFSVKQLKFEIYKILCQYSYHMILEGSENKIHLMKLTFRTAISSHQAIRVITKKCEV